MTANLIIAVLFLLVALVLIVVGAMAATGKLKGNSYIGLRVPEVRQEEAVWMQAHKVAGPFLIVAGVTLLFGAAFAWIASGWLWAAPVIAVIVALVFLSLAGNLGARSASLFAAARKAEQSEPKSEPKPEAEAPAVDFDALRRAAGQADNPADNPPDNPDEQKN